MKRLILMRHTKSDWSFSEPDHARYLNPRGIASARALGHWLRETGREPDTALVSTAVRTRESFGLLGLDIAACFMPSLYHAEPDVMLATLRAAEGDTVLMLGHNPGIASFAQGLVAEPPAHDRFDDYPTGATLVASLAIQDWSEAAPCAARADAFVVPADMPSSW